MEVWNTQTEYKHIIQSRSWTMALDTLEATIISQGHTTSFTSRPGDTDSQGPGTPSLTCPVRASSGSAQHQPVTSRVTQSSSSFSVYFSSKVKQTLRNFLQAFVCYAAVASKSRLSRHLPCSGRVTWSYCQFQPPLHSDLQKERSRKWRNGRLTLICDEISFQFLNELHLFCVSCNQLTPTTSWLFLF